ncbi:SWR1 complex subunit 2-like [Zingiber officinale]|uniref:SWR1 complex subunit 2-like n=1 Tax=Zingiber officinale TaxID=94328 RepID=UPI001C4A8D0C|nr:SWR1 complex subunit 2-like [Zingiber officinale]
MADSEEELVLLDRSSRATRGKRMTKLLNEEVEQDEVFWNQDALMEEENDENYEEEPEVADEFDSDFVDDESEPDDETEVVAEDKLPVKKRLIFPGKTIPKKKSKTKVLAKLETTPKDELSEKSPPSENQDLPDDAEGERTVRKSTRTAVIVRQAEREIRAALQASMKPIKRKKEGEEKRMTQEEMLLEAAQTEIMNLRNLERVLAREEEVKKKAVVHKAVYDGPQIRFLSRDGESHLEFIKGASFQNEISTTPVSYPEKTVCVVTGLPAKYRDPKTGLPYATLEAFKLIRERFLKQEASKKQQQCMDMGDLFDTIHREGFLSKRKRTEVSMTKGRSDPRLGARFRKIPALDMFDQD